MFSLNILIISKLGRSKQKTHKSKIESSVSYTIELKPIFESRWNPAYPSWFFELKNLDGFFFSAKMEV